MTILEFKMAAMELRFTFIVSLNHHEVCTLQCWKTISNFPNLFESTGVLIECSKQLNVIKITCLMKYGVIKYMIVARDLTQFYNIFNFSASRHQHKDMFLYVNLHNSGQHIHW